MSTIAEINKAVRDRMVFHIWITAMGEGGIGYWLEDCDEYVPLNEDGTDRLDFSMGITDGQTGERHTLDPRTIRRGIWLMPTNVKNRYHRDTYVCYRAADEHSWDFDADTADIIVQLGLFGEVRYG